MPYDISTGAKAPQPNRVNSSWTDARVATLKKLWAEGWSGGDIAKELGGVSRNAVIGKVHRLGLGGRATPSRPLKRRVRVAAKRHPMIAEKKPKPKPKSKPKPGLPQPKHITVDELTSKSCRWIYTHDDGSVTYCGCKTVPGSSWCPEHRAIATRAVGKVDTRPVRPARDQTKGLSLEAAEWCAA